MNIVYIIPGAGDQFYCENCIRDIATVRALQAAGHQVTVVPMYLPLAGIANDTPVFYGAIYLYLKQLYPAFKNIPGWLKKMLNSRPFLKLAAGMAGSTRAAGLNELTLSMLRGEEGRQAEELEQLIQWLKQEASPDLVHISNILLGGLAHRLKQALNIPVICSLQDEDVWIRDLDSSSARTAWQLIGEKAGDIDLFVAVSGYYRRFMLESLKVEPERITVVPNGIDPGRYQPAPRAVNPPVIGYLSRMCPEMGLEALCEAFIELQQFPGMESVRLHVTGGFTDDDRRFLRKMRTRLRRHKLSRRVVFFSGFTSSQRADFLAGISLLSVPSPGGTAFGLHLLEALAAGVPLVQPDEGAFPELIAATGAGVCYAHDKPGELARTLAGLLKEPEKLRQLGSRGRRAVLKDYTLSRIANRLTTVYEHCLATRRKEKDAI